MIINTTRYALPESDYNLEVYKKNLIVLHFTAGSTAEGAYQTFRQPGRVGTPYIVDRDGLVYELFWPKMWGYHLGMSGNNPGFVHDKRSIGIEIVNVGPLKRVGDTMNWWPPSDQRGLPTFKTPYCKVSEAEKYKNGGTYRGYSYFASFTEAQADSVGKLVRKLCLDFEIPAIIPPPEKLTAYDPGFFGKWSGIASHQNFRSDKSDIGSAWDWAYFEKGLKG
jgi:N-acetyl-anhydromuramyl-L-alanine amidase AmpD